ncbi:PREDICTED: caspase activity and apoptosis inhibitor 1 isoform X3 [Poecilia mexicana]|uniref:caspase activity and apoptosis inhibitor 1 isoform X3 n=1 Tax=Poecilia mexicana TaxID=48701 RepID=UPI00072E9522|nr:PREDICTED: caspase activity and apoptosis inhibitor 1 isoform X3 [Poecilia mexicana]
MLKKKPSGSEKKRKHSHSEERQNSNKRRSSESQLEDSKDELADPELDRVGSDIEEGGLDLSVPFQPIKAYVSNKREMLQQCFHVLGEKKVRKMLPDELKDCSLEEIKTLCWEQLEPISEKNLTQILAGEETTAGNGDGGTLESQQDNNVDSTSCLKESAKTDDAKQAEGGGSGEESDVLSINADAYDSDIEGPKEEQAVKADEVVAKLENGGDGGERSDRASVNPELAAPETKKDIQSDIDKSVSEILALSSTSSKEEAAEESSGTSQPAGVEAAAQGGASVCSPSIQQLELLELEMRARAIKALMKAGEKKKLCMTNNI